MKVATVAVTTTAAVGLVLVAILESPLGKRTAPQIARPAAHNECSMQAVKDYLGVKINLITPPPQQPFISIEAKISERRLEEDFCLRLAKCKLQDIDLHKINETLLPMLYASGFASCLRDEALEKYDAAARD